MALARSTGGCRRRTLDLDMPVMNGMTDAGRDPPPASEARSSS